MERYNDRMDKAVDMAKGGNIVRAKSIAEHAHKQIRGKAARRERQAGRHATRMKPIEDRISRMSKPPTVPPASYDYDSLRSNPIEAHMRTDNSLYGNYDGPVITDDTFPKITDINFPVPVQ
jgi:hypothetical protein